MISLKCIAHKSQCKNQNTCLRTICFKRGNTNVFDLNVIYNWAHVFETSSSHCNTRHNQHWIQRFIIFGPTNWVWRKIDIKNGFGGGQNNACTICEKVKKRVPKWQQLHSAKNILDWQQKMMRWAGLGPRAVMWSKSQWILCEVRLL